jgi:magnesium transporter
MEHYCLEHAIDSGTWLDICNPANQTLTDIALKYQLDYFQISDSLQHGHLPKFESQHTYNFLILRAFTGNLGDNETNLNELTNKIAFFYSSDKLITVHRTDFPFLSSIQKKGVHIEEVMIQIIGAMVETYNAPLAYLNQKNDAFEQAIFLQTGKELHLEDLYFQKTQARVIKKLLHMMLGVMKEVKVQDKLQTAHQNNIDNLLSITIEFDELYEITQSLLNTYHAVNAQKSNDVMKLLTVFSAFFLPLTFIAGIYGMNFNHMPELQWTWGYYATLFLMGMISLITFLWFRRKNIL